MYFTYLLGWNNCNTYYYGVRYSNTCTLESLGTTYFSSSRYVKDFMVANGLPDIVQVRKVFTDKIAAKRFEERVIRRMKMTKSTRWLNVGNNDAFKDIVMTQQIAKSISNARLGSKHNGKAYTNGMHNIFVKHGNFPPNGYVPGRTPSLKQKEHMLRLNESLTSEKRVLMGIAASEKLKGRKKPEGFGAKVSAKLKGIPKPHMMGANNNSCTEEARRKIREAWKTRITGIWYTDEKTNFYVKPGDKIPQGCRRGRKKNETKHAVRDLN